MLNDVLDPENSRYAEIDDLDDVLFFAVENYVLEFEVRVDDAFAMAVTQNAEDLLHYVGCALLWDWGLVLDNWGEGLAKTWLHDNKIPVTILKQFINLIDKWMINLFQLINLLLQCLPLHSPDLILINYIDRANQFRLQMNSFAQFIKFILFQVRGKNLVLWLDWPLHLTDEVVLFELYLLFLFVDLCGGLLELRRVGLDGAHLFLCGVMRRFVRCLEVLFFWSNLSSCFVCYLFGLFSIFYTFLLYSFWI